MAISFYFHLTSKKDLSLKPIFYNSLSSHGKNFFLDGVSPQIEYPPPIIYQKNTISQVTCSQIISSNIFAVLSGEEEEKGNEVRQYIVKEGDTISSIAQKFNISVNTILWANNLTEKSILKPGQKLVILPVSGVLHFVKKGETISEIAEMYHISQKDIINFNDVNADGKIYVGDLLIIPGGEPLRKSHSYSYAVRTPIASNYFICPILPPCRITQGLHWYNAVDLGHGICGDPVLAAAGGIIQKIGYHPIAGNYIRILHPNGVVTFYGHLSKIIVSPGEKVSQGQIIGYIGHTGYTIPRGFHGCHLHFEVRGARNPFASY